MSKLMTPQEARKYMKIQLIQRDVSQSRLADELGVSRGYISAVLIGKKPPSEKMAKWFGLRRNVTVSYSVGE